MENVVQGEDACQLPVDGAEHGVAHVEALGQGDLQQRHEGGRAHSNLLVADDGGKAAPLMALDAAGGAAVDGALGAQQVVEDFVQAAARVPDEGGGDRHHLFHRVVPKDLDAVQGDGAGGEEVGVGEEDGAPLPGHAGPPAQSGAAGGQPPGQHPEGTAEQKHARQAGRRGGGGRQAPHQPLRGPPTHRSDEGEQQAGQQQQRRGHPEDALGSVVLLDLAAEADGRARPLGVGPAAVPGLLVQGDQIGLGGRRRRAAGHAQALPLGVGPPQGEEQGQPRRHAVGEALPLRGQAPHGQGVGQGEEAGEGGQGVGPGPQSEQPRQTQNQPVRAQQHGGRQQDGRQKPLERDAGGQGGGQRKGQQRSQRQPQHGQAQQQHQHRAQPQQAQAPAVPARQLRRRQVRGRGRLSAGLALPEEPARRGLLLVHAGDEPFEPEGLVRDLHPLLLKHLLGICVRLALEMLDARLERGRVILRKFQHLVRGGRLPRLGPERRRDGLLLFRVLLRPVRVLPAGRLRRRGREGHHVLRRRGPPLGLRPGQVRAGGLRPGAEFRQNLLQREFRRLSVLIQLVIPVV